MDLGTDDNFLSSYFEALIPKVVFSASSIASGYVAENVKTRSVLVHNAGHLNSAAGYTKFERTYEYVNLDFVKPISLSVPLHFTKSIGL